MSLSSDSEDSDPVRLDAPQRPASNASGSASDGQTERTEDSDDQAAALYGGEEEEGEADVPTEEKNDGTIFIQVPHLNDRFDGEVHYVKLPNFLSIDSKVFDEQSFEMEAEDDEVMNEGGRSRVKLKVENTIRWRLMFDAEGNEFRESNAKLVRYSDNSMALFIGSEAFDVCTVPITNEHRHLFIRQGNGLQAAALFGTKLVFRPQSINSSTHYKITRNIADKVARTQKVKMMPLLTSNPELDKERMIKAEEDRLRSIARKEYQRRRSQQRSYSRQISGGYLESDKRGSDDDNGETISLAAIKRKYKISAKDYASQFDHEDDYTYQEESADQPSDDDDEEEEDEDEEEEEDGEGQKERTTRRVVEDDDED